MPGPRAVMEELVDFLKLFQDASEELSQTAKPTMHMVVPIILQLKQHCDQPSPNGSNAMKATKRRVKELIMEKIDFDILHKIACFLCPAFRTMRMFSLAEQNVVLQVYRSWAFFILTKWAKNEQKNPVTPTKCIAHKETSSRSQSIGDYSRLPDAFIDRTLCVCKNDERGVTDVLSICTTMFDYKKF